MSRAVRVALLLAALLAARPVGADRAHARASHERGVSLLAAGDRARALVHFERAMADDPDYLAAYDAATELWIAGREWTRLVDRLSRLTLRHPEHAPAWYALAFAYRRLGRAALAIACYEEYASIRSADPDPHFGIAMLSLEAGDRARAAVALRRYLSLERRPERADFIDRARAELAELDGAPPGPSVRPIVDALTAGPTPLALLAHLGRSAWVAWRAALPESAR